MKQEETLPVKIGQMTYHLKATEDPQYIKEIARQADELLAGIQKANPRINATNAAVLALVNALDLKEKAYRQSAEAETDLETIFRKVDESAAELLRLREQCWELKKDLLYYRNLCELYEERLAQTEDSQAASRTTQRNTGGATRQRPRPLDRLQTSFEEMALYQEKATDDLS